MEGEVTASDGVEDYSDSEETTPASPDEEPEEVNVVFDGLERESKVQRNGTRFYLMASLSIPGMPTTKVFLGSPSGSTMPEFKVAAVFIHFS